MTLAPPSEAALALHAEIVASHRKARKANYETTVLLTRMLEAGYHLQLGYRDLADYAEQVLDMSERKARTLVNICESLPRLPVMVKAVADGELGWTKAREILKVALPETEERWVEHAKSVTSRVLEDQIEACQMGDLPSHVGREKRPERSRLVLHTSTVNVDFIRSALQWARAQTGVDRSEVDDGDLLRLMLQRVMYDAPAETAPTAERYKILVENCPECGRTEGVDAELTDTMTSQAICHAEVVEMRPGPERGHLTHTVPPAVHRVVLARDRYRCRVPGCNNWIWLDVHHVKARASGGRHHEGNLITMCGTHHDLLHDGHLGIEAREGRFWFAFPDGREASAPMDPRMEPTWVAQSRWSLTPANGPSEVGDGGGRGPGDDVGTTHGRYRPGDEQDDAPG